MLALDGVGGMYGFTPTRAPRGGAGGAWPRLLSLCAGALEQQTNSGLALTRSCLNDELLLRLAGGSPRLRQLGARGSSVTAAGLRALIESMANAAATTASTSAPMVVDTSAADADAGAGAGAGAGALDAELGAAAEDEDAFPALARLDVTQSALCCDEGLQTVGELLSGSLVALSAARAGGHVTDDGLAGLHACARLEELDIGGSSVTDEGLRSLLASPAGARLRFLGIASCRSLGRAARQAVAQGGLAGLRKHLGISV